MLSLKLYQPALLDPTAFAADLSKFAPTYSHIIRRDGGYALASMTIDKMPQSFLTHLFYECLGFHFEEKSGGYKTWDGLLWEMDLTIGATTYRRTIDLVDNSVKTTYIDTAGDTQTTSAADNAGSQKIYGIREALQTAYNVSQTEAEADRDSHLTEFAWPWPRPVGIGLGIGDNSLLMKFSGYIMTANNRYVTAGDGSTDDLSTWIQEIIEADMQFLLVGGIDANTLQTTKEVQTPQRAYDTVQEQVARGDASQNPYRFFVDNDRRAYYRVVDKTPTYYKRGGKYYASSGGTAEVDPWSIKPAVVRDLDYPFAGKTDYAGWLEQVNDAFISEVEVSAAGVSLKTDLFEESDIMTAQERYRKILNNAAAGQKVKLTKRQKQKRAWERNPRENPLP